METFKVDLFKKNSIDNLIKELRRYKAHLPEKLENFTRQLAEVGMVVAKQSLDNAQGDSKIGRFVIESASNSDRSITVMLHFRGDDVLFWEFGAGIMYNEGKIHPKAHEMGYGVGTYPGQIHAINPGYWWYKGEDGKLHFSMGTEAAMPMYNAYLEMVKKVDEVAERSFR